MEPRRRTSLFGEPVEREDDRFESVSQLNSRVRTSLERSYNNVRVTGEISNLSAAYSGHLYFTLKDGDCRPAKAARIDAPDLWPRHPPVRTRKTVADSWLKLTIDEGRNRQVRRMTAAIGHPTLRLVRWQIGDWDLTGLAPGEWRSMAVHAPKAPAARQRRPRRPAHGPRPRTSGRR